jgi:hypothetical protein
MHPVTKDAHHEHVNFIWKTATTKHIEAGASHGTETWCGEGAKRQADAAKRLGS